MDPILTSEERQQLEQIAQTGSLAALRRRAQLLLLYNEGLSTSEVADRVHLSRARTRFWRRQFRLRRIDLFRLKEAVPEKSLVSVVPELEDPSVRHALQVRDLACLLFDWTLPLHGLGEEHRRLLAEATRAAPGITQGPPQLIRDELEARLGDRFSSQELVLLSIILSLRSGVISGRTFSSQDLEPQVSRQALILAALLRIALALDSSASQSTHLVRLEGSLDPTHPDDTLYLLVSGPQAETDARSARQAGRLWTRLGFPVLQVSAISQPAPEPPLPQPAATVGLLPEDSLAEAGRKVLLFQFAEMLRHEEGTRLGQDIEALHDMRVATRRMRAAFDVFAPAFEDRVLRRHLKGLRAAGRALGRVRDLDVFMEKAQAYLETLAPEQRYGLEPLLAGWQSEREAARTVMVAHLDSPEYAEFKRRFNRFVQTPGKGAAGQMGFSGLKRVREIAPLLIYQRLGAVRAFDEILGNATIEQLHALRIEFKKLRYSVEYFREVLGPEAKSVIDELKKIQDHLGDLNDAQVAAQLLSAFLAGWDERQAATLLSKRQDPQPVLAYLSNRHAERHRLLLSFPQAWERFNCAEFRHNLALAIAAL